MSANKTKQSNAIMYCQAAGILSTMEISFHLLGKE